MENKILKEALFLLDLGYSVIPVSKSKIPFKNFPVKTYQRERHPTEKEVIHWFTNQYPDANLAICTGKISGVSVIDVDYYKKGVINRINRTKMMAQSPRLGIHYYYKYNALVPGKAGILPNIDFRNDGNIIVVPPSNSDGKSYKWLTNILAPEDLEDFPVDVIPDQEEFKFSGKMLVEKNPPGTRNERTCQMAGKLVRHLPEPEWDSVGYPLLKAYDLNFNEPPLQIQYGEGDLLKKWNGIKKSEQSKEPDLSSFEDLKDIESLGRIKPLNLSGIINKESTKKKWMVNNMIPAGEITILSGDPNIGKTWLYLMLAIKISEGKKFLSHDLQKGNVLLVDKENGIDIIQERFKMLNAPEHVNIFYETMDDKLITEETVDELLKFCIEKNIKTVMFDSLRRCLEGDENSSADINTLYLRLKKFLINNISVILTHHLNKGGEEGKFKSLRGSTDIQGMCTAHIMVKKDGDDHIILHYEKARNFRMPKDLKLKITTDGETFYSLQPVNYVETFEKQFADTDILKEILQLFVPGLILPEDGIVKGMASKFKQSEVLIKKNLSHLVNQNVLNKETIKGVTHYGMLSKESNS